MVSVAGPLRFLAPQRVGQSRLLTFEIQINSQGMCYLQGPVWNHRTQERHYTVNIANRKFVGTYKMMKELSSERSYDLLTNSNSIAVFLVKFIIVQKLLSSKTEVSKGEFCEFANQRSRIFSQAEHSCIQWVFIRAKLFYLAV